MATLLITHDLALGQRARGPDRGDARRAHRGDGGHAPRCWPTSAAPLHRPPARGDAHRERRRRWTTCTPSPATCLTCAAPICRPAATPSRCERRLPVCDTGPVLVRDVGPGHTAVACWNPAVSPWASRCWTMVDVMSRAASPIRRHASGGCSARNAVPAQVHAVVGCELQAWRRARRSAWWGRAGAASPPWCACWPGCWTRRTGSIRFDGRDLSLSGVAAAVRCRDPGACGASRSCSRMPGRASTRASRRRTPSPTRCAGCMGLRGAALEGEGGGVGAAVRAADAGAARALSRTSLSPAGSAPAWGSPARWGRGRTC